MGWPGIPNREIRHCESDEQSHPDKGSSLRCCNDMIQP
jgi:hypothetical protein